MTKFTDRLWSDLVQEHGPALARRPTRIRPGPSPACYRGQHARAGGPGTALGLGLTATGGTPTAAGGAQVVTDAYTITQNSSGSVLMQINQQESINAANTKLNAMIKEQVVLRMASGPAPVSGPKTCTPGVSNMQGPTVKVLRAQTARRSSPRAPRGATRALAPGT